MNWHFQVMQDDLTSQTQMPGEYQFAPFEVGSKVFSLPTCTVVSDSGAGSTLDIEPNQVTSHIPDLPFHLSAIIDWASDAITSISLEGVIMSWNAAAERLYGYSAEEVLGEQISIIIPEDHRLELQNILVRVGKGEKIEP